MKEPRIKKEAIINNRTRYPYLSQINPTAGNKKQAMMYGTLIIYPVISWLCYKVFSLGSQRSARIELENVLNVNTDV